MADFQNFEEARGHNLEKPVTVTDDSNQSRLLDENISKLQEWLVHYQHYNPKLFDNLDCNRQFFGKVLKGSQDENVVTALHAERISTSQDKLLRTMTLLLQKPVNSD